MKFSSDGYSLYTMCQYLVTQQKTGRLPNVCPSLIFSSCKNYFLLVKYILATLKTALKKNKKIHIYHFTDHLNEYGRKESIKVTDWIPGADE